MLQEISFIVYILATAAILASFVSIRFLPPSVGCISFLKSILGDKGDVSFLTTIHLITRVSGISWGIVAKY